jgi:HD-like signal output (HDOD) protein
VDPMDAPDPKIQQELLSALAPIRDLCDANRQRLARKARLSELARGDKLLAEDEYRWLTYILEGTVQILVDNGKPETVSAQGIRAREPLFTDRSHGMSVVAIARSKILRFDRRLFEALWSEECAGGTAVIEVQVSDAENALFGNIFQACSAGSIELPSLPDIALRIQSAVNNPAVGVAEVAQIVRLDPALAARLIQVANSPMYRRISPATTIRDAVLRLGLQATRNLAVSFALGRLFRGKSPITQRGMRELYAHSVRVSALSYVMAKTVGGFEPERALLAGLLHDIGVIPILTYAEDHPDLASSASLLEATVTKLRGLVGALVLGKWGFDAALVTVASEAEEWRRDPQPAPDYCDIVLLAQLHCYVGTERMSSLPRIDEVPAYRKLGLSAYGPDIGIEVLHAAQEDITALEQLLKA